MDKMLRGIKITFYVRSLEYEILRILSVMEHLGCLILMVIGPLEKNVDHNIDFMCFLL